MPDEVIIPAATEVAKVVTPDYREAVYKVRDTIASVPALREEEWSSLTKHVTELHILDRFGYLRCCSGDSVLDGIIPDPDEKEIRFNPKDQAFLRARGIQVKGRRYVGKGYSFTGDIKLSSAFKYLYIVWVDVSYRVMESEVYRLEYDAVESLIRSKEQKNPGGSNNCKITRAEAQRHGNQVPPAVAPPEPSPTARPPG